MPTDTERSAPLWTEHFPRSKPSSIRNSGFWERNAAGLAGLVAAAAYASFQGKSLPTGLHDLFNAAVNIAAIGVGFLLTASSILVSADDRKIVQAAKQIGAYRLLVKYMLAATYWCLVTAVVSAVALLFDPQWRLVWYPMAFTGWLFFAVAAAAALLRVLVVFAHVLLGLAED